MVICVTNRTLCNEDFLTRFASICKAKPKSILLREKDLDEQNYKTLADKCLTICKQHHVDLVLHTHIEVARALGVTAIHLPLHILEAQHQNLTGFTSIGTSIHAVKEVAIAEQLGATYLFAGHIFQTDCKKDLVPRGISFLNQILKVAHVPVHPIGGIHLKNVQEVVNAGAKDFCIMSELMTCDHVEKRITEYNQVTPKTDLCTIPGVATRMKARFITLGYHWVEDLKNADAQDMYQRDCMLNGCTVDRCVLYVYRLAVYVANTPNTDPNKMKWWYWKDEVSR